MKNTWRSIDSFFQIIHTLKNKFEAINIWIITLYHPINYAFLINGSIYRIVYFLFTISCFSNHLRQCFTCRINTIHTIIIKNGSLRCNIKWKFCTILCNTNDWLSNSMTHSKLIHNISI